MFLVIRLTYTNYFAFLIILLLRLSFHSTMYATNHKHDLAKFKHLDQIYRSLERTYFTHIPGNIFPTRINAQYFDH